ncbi:MAG: glycine zipper family protein [Myxococcota bacterium]
MDVFLYTITTFPTVVFTVLLGFAMLYWGLVMVGGVDVDGWGSGSEAVFDAGDGALEALDAGDGAMDAAEGALEPSSTGTGGGLMAVLSWFGLRRMPLSVTMSVVILVAWVVSYFATKALLPALTSFLPVGIASGLVGLGSLLAALPATALASVPLEPLFRFHRAEDNASLVGKTCRIQTGSVDDRSGAAVVVDGDSSDIIQVRCRPGHLRRGETALIVDYDRLRNVFLVEPMPEILGTREAIR